MISNGLNSVYNYNIRNKYLDRFIINWLGSGEVSTPTKLENRFGFEVSTRRLIHLYINLALAIILAMILFIVSEVFFFLCFFLAYYHCPLLDDFCCLGFDELSTVSYSCTIFVNIDCSYKVVKELSISRRGRFISLFYNELRDEIMEDLGVTYSEEYGSKFDYYENSKGQLIDIYDPCSFLEDFQMDAIFYRYRDYYKDYTTRVDLIDPYSRKDGPETKPFMSSSKDPDAIISLEKYNILFDEL